MPEFSNYDDYIEKCEAFAQPILKHLKACVNEACPEVEEEFKWNFPNFTYKKNILCHMAGFKKHVTFGFWLGSIMEDPENILQQVGSTGMGQFGKISSLDDLPEKNVLIHYIRQAVQLTEDGKKLPTGNNGSAKLKKVPKVLQQALNDNPLAQETFENFSPSNKNDYIEWFVDAKTEKTQLKRLNQTIEWLCEGKPRNWKYMKKS